MRFFPLPLAVAGALLLTGCSNLVSLNPFVKDDQAVLDTALPGLWMSSDDKVLLTIRNSGTGYSIRYNEDSDVLKFDARMMNAGEAKLLDLVPNEDSPLTIRPHSIMRVWTDGATLRCAYLDSDWLMQQAALQLTVAPSKDRDLIVSPGDMVRAFLLKTGADPKALNSEIMVFRRLQ